MHDHDPSMSGLTRRQLLERGALAGGAVLAAQSLGAVSALAQTSPPPPDPTDPPEPVGSLPENFQLVVDYDGDAYGVKYQPTGGWTFLAPGGACSFDTRYSRRPAPGLLTVLSAPGVVTTGTDEDGHRAYILSLPDGVGFIEGRPKDDSCIVDPDDYRDPCGGHVERMADGSYAFAACD